MAKQKSEDLSVARSVLDLAVGFVTTIEEAGGTIEDARRAIFKDELLKKRIGMLVMGKLKIEGFPCQKNVPHLIPDWVTEVVEDVEPTSQSSLHRGGSSAPPPRAAAQAAGARPPFCRTMGGDPPREC